MRFHDLRHAPASLLLSYVKHPLVVPDVLDHPSMAPTVDTHSHLMEGTSRSSAEED